MIEFFHSFLCANHMHDEDGYKFMPVGPPEEKQKHQVDVTLSTQYSDKANELGPSIVPAGIFKTSIGPDTSPRGEQVKPDSWNPVAASTHFLGDDTVLT